MDTLTAAWDKTRGFYESPGFSVGDFTSTGGSQSGGSFASSSAISARGFDGVASFSFAVALGYLAPGPRWRHAIVTQADGLGYGDSALWAARFKKFRETVEGQQS